MFQAIDIAKQKSDQEIQDVSDHNLRKTSSKNVNKKKSRLNKYLVGGADQDTIQKMNELLATVPKFRKDANKVINLVFSASPEFFNDKKKSQEWELLTQKFIEDTFGKENILYSVIHLDEKTPHIHCSLVPIKDGKLNSSYWFDGPQKLKKFHTDYNNVIKHLGLKRGQPKLKGDTKPDQKSLESYYKKVNASTKYEEELDSKIDRVFDKVEDRLNNPTLMERFNPFKVVSELKPVFKMLAKTISHYRTKSKDQEKSIKRLAKLEQLCSDYELKFETMGLKPSISFMECNSVKEDLIAMQQMATASLKPAPATEPIIEQNKTSQNKQQSKFRPK